MLEVKSEKMVKCFFPKSCLDDLGGVYSLAFYLTSSLNSSFLP
jgi:hypothetical protein